VRKDKTLQRNDWVNKIQLCRQSGKSAKAWCRENQIVYSTFVGWSHRLKLRGDLDSALTGDLPSKGGVASSFIELKDQSKSISSISLECAGVYIHLSADSDETLLRKCLKVLRGGICWLSLQTPEFSFFKML
jgi:hypothetical protein